MAITFVQKPTAGTTNSTQSVNQTGSATWTTGNTIIVIVSIRTTTISVSSITQSAGSNTYTFQSGASINNGTAVRHELWTATNITGGTFFLNVNLSGNSKSVSAAAEYSGVQALGVTSSSNATGASPSQSLTTQDNNNFIVGGFSGQGTNAFTANVGNLRANAVTSGGAASSNDGGAEVDNTVATPGSVTISVINSDTQWAMGAIELRTVAPAVTSTVTPRALPLCGVGA